ncbi:MAG: hypothetical protein IKY87_08175 [Paludibacteraceae bacterium]|nr:hypothetical protein [Paludibacteraceae bacterium]
MNEITNNNWEIQLTSSNWYTSQHVSVYGYAYDNGNRLLANAALCDYFDVNDIATFRSRLQDCNGLFSVICHSEHFCAAAVDPSRIYPLYYRQQNNKIHISDDPHTLLQPNDSLDVNSVQEYHVAGYPLGPKTLIQDILQVLPGGILLKNGSQEQYYSYLAKYSELSHPANKKALNVLHSVFSRLVQSINGKQIVVPLSAGNDSRLILCMLRHLQYENVICYTVGRPKNKEEIIAVKVAEKLGYPLYIIDTTKKELMDYIQLNSGEFQKYYRHIGALGNFMWLFEYVAIKWLKSRNLLQDGSVFIPGHSADFNAGSQLLKACIRKNDKALHQAHAMMFDHFEYAYNRNVHNATKKHFIAEHRNSTIATWSIFQSFIFNHKLPYNINNSARVYQFFGYDVRLPYWDKAFLEMFRVMPFEDLYGCLFYTKLIRENLFKKMGVDFPNPYPSKWYFYKMKLRKRIKKVLLPFIHRNTYKMDSLGELLLSKPMLDELIAKKQYRLKVGHFANEIMKDWYLMKVKEMLNQ